MTSRRVSQRRSAARPASFYVAVWELVRRVPYGRVVTYGQLATWLGSPSAARAVGYAMFNVRDPAVPWHRVVNARGEISIGGALHRPELQRVLLEHEGVTFSKAGTLDLERFGWVLPASLARKWLRPHQIIALGSSPRARHRLRRR
jgi:methylated-DNA-protein-cysteine methyltransferase-like protein